MKQSLSITKITLVVSLSFLGGCASSPKPDTLSSYTRINSGSYVSADDTIGSDIRDILTQGGVYLSSSGYTQATPNQETVKVLSDTAKDLDTLVSQLSKTESLSSNTGVTTLALVSPAATKLKSNEVKAQVFESIVVTPPAQNIPVPDLSKTTTSKKKPAVKAAPKKSVIELKTKSSYKKPTVARF